VKLNTTPQNQISPVCTVEIRTDTLRHCLSDLREHGRELGEAMGATGHRHVILDDGTELSLTQQSASERGCWYPGTVEAVKLDSNYNSSQRYAIHPRGK